MSPYDISQSEDHKLYRLVSYPNGRTLYELMIEMPLEDLQAYPQKGYRWWMGRKAKSSWAMHLRDYVLHWRLFQLEFCKKYSPEHLKSLSLDALRSFINCYLKSVPLWAYDGPVRDAAKLIAGFDIHP